ncbi:lipopolysaccharide biosynthesis protein [Akkermansiaceae bacterium]|nr:lipopolysaccharide biosynthesis protein [Akkermansiaceae bacterium]
MSLREKTIKGVVWVFIETFVVKFLYFGALILLARWLGPKEFGLIGMIALFIELGKVLSDSGMTSSLIRTEELTEEDNSTVFIINLFMSLFVYSIVYLIAPLVSVFFEQPILVQLIRVYGLVFIFIGLSAVHLAILTKEMNFSRITKISIPGIIIGVFVGLYLGYNNYSVWSIVWMYLTSEIIKTILLWILSDWRPKLVFSKAKFKYHYAFGWKLMLASSINIIFKNITNLLIGKYHSASTLGYFERSKQLSEYPSITFTSIISRVAYPLLCSLKNDQLRLEDTYKNLIKTSYFIIAPVMLCIASLAEPLFLLFLGGEWLPAVPIFQILCLAKMLYPVHAFNLNILQVYGRSDLFLRLELIKKLIFIVSIAFAFQFGIFGLVWCSVFTSFTSLIVNLHYSGKLLRYPMLTQFKDIIKIFFQALITALSMFFFINLRIFEGQFLLQLIMASIAGSIFYLGISYVNKESPLHIALSFLKVRSI